MLLAVSRPQYACCSYERFRAHIYDVGSAE